MNLELFNNIINDAQNNNFIKNFMEDLQKALEKNNYGEESVTLINPTHNGNKIITKYRDKMYLERSNILNNYAKETRDKGEMYYVYNRNSKMENAYNLCICEEGKSHIVIEVTENELPKEAELGSVLRKNGEDYILDNEATKIISEEIEKMKDNLVEEQTKFLESKRIEGHVYELSEKEEDRAWLFDITDNGNEEVEEIGFPKELLKDAKEGDLFVYKNGEYQRYLQ